MTAVRPRRSCGSRAPALDPRQMWRARRRTSGRRRTDRARQPATAVSSDLVCGQGSARGALHPHEAAERPMPSTHRRCPSPAARSPPAPPPPGPSSSGRAAEHYRLWVTQPGHADEPAELAAGGLADMTTPAASAADHRRRGRHRSAKTSWPGGRPPGHRIAPVPIGTPPNGRLTSASARAQAASASRKGTAARSLAVAARRPPPPPPDCARPCGRSTSEQASAAVARQCAPAARPLPGPGQATVPVTGPTVPADVHLARPEPTHNLRWVLPVTPGISTVRPFLFGGCALGGHRRHGGDQRPAGGVGDGAVPLHTPTRRRSSTST
jgi:hypothetical protein